MGRRGLSAEVRERAGPRRWPDEPRDESITPEHVAREVRELARRWDEVGEREAPLGARWRALRLSLSRCSDEAYAAARDAGIEVVARAPSGLKCAIVHSFPHEHGWAADVARELLAMIHVPPWGVRVLGSLDNPALALDLVRALGRARVWPVVACAHDMVASMGEGAADVLIELAPHATETRDRNALLHAIALVKTEKVAAWLAQQLDDTIGRRVAAGFFREAPDLAQVLEPLAKKRSSAGRAAKALMALAGEEASPVSRVARADDIPEILRSPPWRSRAAHQAGGVVPDVPLVMTSAQSTIESEWSPYSGSAWAVAHAYFERPEAREAAHRWLVTYPLVAAIGLVPMAVGEDARRRAAGRVLRMLRDEGHAAAVEEAAARYGEAIANAVSFVLSPDPRLDVPIEPPSIPKNLATDGLPPPRLRSGAALPKDATRSLAELLVICSDLVPYVGAEEVASACDPRSLEAFSWALFETWVATGSATKSAWPLLALGVFGGDAVARDLGPRLRGWAQQRQSVRALEGVRVLEAIALRGSDVALIQLVNTAEGVRADEVRRRAEQALETVARTRGLDMEQLADRAAPMLEDIVLDFGSRAFTLSASSSGETALRDASGARLDSLPRATKDDDPKLVASAKEAYGAFKADAQEAFRAQTRRFENALRTQRTWSREDFEAVVLQKRVLFEIARRLVWAVGDATFRVVEDRSYADAEDRPFALATGARVRIAHPLELDGQTLARWGSLFGDYEIVQPFAQIGRETFALTQDEKTSSVTNRFATKSVEPSRLYSLEHRAWTRHEATFTTAAGALFASFTCTPGFYTRPPPPQTVGQLRVWTKERAARAPVLGDVDRISMSEILRDVTLLGT